MFKIYLKGITNDDAPAKNFSLFLRSFYGITTPSEWENYGWLFVIEPLNNKHGSEIIEEANRLIKKHNLKYSTVPPEQGYPQRQTGASNDK